MKYPFSFRPLIAFPRPLKSPRKRARFDSSIDMTFSLLASELKAVKAKNAVLQLHIENGGLRADGLPKIALPSPEVVLSFETDDRAVSMPCDTYTDWRDNVRAIALPLDSLRAVDRYGVTQNGEQYVGWAALPPAPKTCPTL